MPSDILKIISALYPNNHYHGSYGTQPKWLDYPIEGIVNKLISDIKENCNADITKVYWERNYESCYTINIAIPKTDSKNHKDIVLNLTKETTESIYEMFLELSVLGPYACINGWNRKYLNSYGEYKAKYYTTISLDKCILLEDCINNILSLNNITLLSQELLSIPLEHMTGNPHSKPWLPTIYNCLFGE